MKNNTKKGNDVSARWMSETFRRVLEMDPAEQWLGADDKDAIIIS